MKCYICESEMINKGITNITKKVKMPSSIEWECSKCGEVIYEPVYSEEYKEAIFELTEWLKVKNI